MSTPPFAGYRHSLPGADHETAVFIHGAGHDHLDWLPLLASDSRHQLTLPACNFIAVDLPGHGKHSANVLSAVEDMADWLLTLPEVTTAKSLHFVGHSMGSLIALEAAARLTAHSQVSSLSLLGFNFPMSVNQDLLDTARRAPEQAFDLICKWSFASPPRDTQRLTQLRSNLINARDENILATDLQACRNYQGGDQAWRALSCPVLLVSGTADKMTPSEHAETWSEDYKQANFEAVAGVGHALIDEAVDEIGQLLSAFITQHAKTGTNSTGFTTRF